MSKKLILLIQEYTRLAVLESNSARVPNQLVNTDDDVEQEDETKESSGAGAIVGAPMVFKSNSEE